MSKRVYGNLTNRLEEGKNYTGREIQVGDDITEYYWSDRHCYYITEVIDQKHIKVKPYQVAVDKDLGGGPGTQNWLYFKTFNEKAKYYNDWYDAHPEQKFDGYTPYDYHEDREPEEWVYRYKKWKRVLRFPNGEIAYDNLQPISFGQKSYYYDWEF